MGIGRSQEKGGGGGGVVGQVGMTHNPKGQCPW